MPVDYNKVFPETISRGVVGGPEFNTQVTSFRSGGEERNTAWQHPLHSYDAGLGMRGTEDLYKFQEFFYATRGMLRSFRWKDWADYRTTTDQTKTPTALDQSLGTGDGASYYFRTYKRYGDYYRRISNPRVNSCLVSFDGDIQDPDTYFVDDQNGTIVFLTPPADGVEVTWGGEFDVPVRFDSDYIPIQLDLYLQGSVPTIPVKGLRFVENIVEADYLDAIEILSEYNKTELFDLANVYDYTVNTHWKGFW